MAARPPRWRRRLAVLALLSLLAATAVLLYGLALGERLGIRQIDGLRLSRHGLQLDSVQILNPLQAAPDALFAAGKA